MSKYSGIILVLIVLFLIANCAMLIMYVYSYPSVEIAGKLVIMCNVIYIVASLLVISVWGAFFD